MKKSVFITGIHGFLGTWCASHFSASGFNVIGIGRPAAENKKHPHPGNGILSGCIDGDITTAILDAAVERHGLPLALIHCAGGSSVGFSYENPKEDFLRTVASTVEVLEFSRKHAASVRIVYPSSAAVYGVPERLPISEDSPCLPVSPYGRHKYMAEQICRSYATEWKIPIAIIRFFSLYGEGLGKQLLWDACHKAMRGEFSFFGAGNEIRDWLSIRDAVRLIALAVDHAAPDCPVSNGGTGQGMSVKDMLTEIGRFFHPDISPSFSGKSKPGDPPEQVADISRARNWGFTPLVKIQSGIASYVEWFRKEFER
ncbi:MAG: NAD(P)-dependent oxidoreductase [Candidatus Accumulibacter sp.]|jgi:UDP-glucose 4-epimerase|nr:NAD(P)-dependent oxidoreductase [Accumulibacter sp.]